MAVPHFNQFRIGIDKRACVNARKIKVSPAGSPGSLRFGAEWLGYFFNRLMHRDLDCSRSLTTIVDWTSAESPVNTSRLLGTHNLHRSTSRAIEMSWQRRRGIPL